MYCKICDVCGSIYDFRDDYGRVDPEYEDRTTSIVELHLRGADVKTNDEGEYVITRESWDLCPKCTAKIYGRLQMMKKEANE